MEPRDNPMGLNGFEFVEFTGPDPEALADLFTKMGFTHVGTHKTKNVRRYNQGDINFLLNMEPEGQVAGFREAHGPSANAMAFRVADAKEVAELIEGIAGRGARRCLAATSAPPGRDPWCSTPSPPSSEQHRKLLAP